MHNGPEATEQPRGHAAHACAATRYNALLHHPAPPRALRVSCRDLEDFFCTLGLPSAKVCRNAVGTFLIAAQLLEAGVAVPPHPLGRDRVYVALRSLAMGDVNALGHAQQAHGVMLEAGGAASPDQLRRYGRPLPRGQCQVGGYVDDLSVMQIHGHDDDPDIDRELIARATTTSRRRRSGHLTCV